MVAYLSQEWLDRQHELLGGLPDAPGVTVRVQHVVTGGPAGEVTYHVAYEAGRVVDAGLAPDPDAELVLTASYEVAAAIAVGEVEPAVAYMQGRLKAEGVAARLTPLLALTQTAGYVAATSTLHAETDA